MYFDQPLLAARKAHVVYSDQLLGAALCIHFISNHDNIIKPNTKHKRFYKNYNLWLFIKNALA